MKESERKRVRVRENVGGRVGKSDSETERKRVK